MERILVLLAFKIPDALLRKLQERHGNSYEFKTIDPKHDDLRLAEQADVLAVASPDKRVISAATGCRWLHIMSAGVDEYLAMEAVRSKESLVLTNSAGAYGIQISEHVFAVILALSRRMKEVLRNQEHRRWEVPKDDEGGLREIYGMTMAIVGLGHVGLEIARRANGFGIHVLGVRRDASSELKIPGYGEYIDEILIARDLDRAVATSDIIVDSLPLTPETKGLFDSARFQSFKKGAIFINVGRGPTVIEKDLTKALQDGVLGGAALDVFEEEPLPGNSPLWKMENVIITPHCSGTSDNSLLRAVAILDDNLERYSRGETLCNIVDRGTGY
ncbi:MAG: D-2-hydroxyacid dehydrogenase [Nitrososphaerales archaeon]|jgi:phosphoglycerate dehydrogenase-like enzyme